MSSQEAGTCDEHTIACTDCGAAVTTRRANTKYCAVCRLLRDLPYTDGRLRKCAFCADRYAPLDIRDGLCGRHAARRAKYGVGPCAYCGAVEAFVRPDIHVCNTCARDKQHRASFIRALEARQRKAQEASRVAA